MMCLLTGCSPSQEKLIESTGVQETTSQTIAETTANTETINIHELVVDGQIHTYPNLGLRVTVPDGWVLLDDGDLQEVYGIGLGSGEKALDQDLMALIGAMAYPLSEQVVFNPSFLITLERIDDHVTPEVFLRDLLEELDQSGIPFEAKDLVLQEIDGDSYWTTQLEINIGSEIIGQWYGVKKVAGYMMMINCTYHEGNDFLVQEILGQME